MNNFYSSTIDNKLRFGDVIQGSIFLTPKIDNLDENYYKDFDIKFENIDYAVIITPCCTIQKSNKTREKFISITPLLKIYLSFLKNEYFSQDLTLINIKVPIEKTIPEERWNSLTDEEKQQLLEKGKVYPFQEVFIYDRNDLLKPYKFKDRKGNIIESNYYMINFRNIHKINCDHENLKKFKILELSIQNRINLSNKIKDYFRIADEDIL